MERIYHRTFGIQRLDEVADAYIFQGYTGFAYQDLYCLSKDNIILVDRKKERWLCKHTGKTGLMEMVSMLPIIESIIEKVISAIKDELREILEDAMYEAGKNSDRPWVRKSKSTLVN